ncbi:hypothetical protein TMO_2305 [Tistrella mobilis KA081020-065]|uniref:Uncharacterized protein n=2 Tax=Tistrella mobilis TaxID=171437 RepID=I3TN05_TISMK|nr:hypothetical protein TMO_2305 [Tistrella mobilis KA081020-065]
MEDIASLAQKLRNRVMRDPKTGQVMEKPQPPRMRKVVKGFWTYGEVPGDVEDLRQEKKTR